jgi:hypothetical protein
MDLVFGLELKRRYGIVTELRSVPSIPDVMHEPCDQMEWLVLRLLSDELLVITH